jgi:hypothetical protein
MKLTVFPEIAFCRINLIFYNAFLSNELEVCLKLFTYLIILNPLAFLLRINIELNKPKIPAFAKILH